jgi:hypothetical protein
MTPDYTDLTARAAESHLTVCRMLSPWASDLPKVVDANTRGPIRRGIHGEGTLSLKDIGIPTSISPLHTAPKALSTGTVIALTDQALDTLLITAAMTARYRLVDVSAYPRAGHLVLPRPIMAGRRSRMALVSEISWVPNSTYVTAIPWTAGWRTVGRTRELLVQTFDQTREPEVPCNWELPKALRDDISGEPFYAQYLLSTLWRMIAQGAFDSRSVRLGSVSVTVYACRNEGAFPEVKATPKRRPRVRAAEQLALLPV